MLLDDSKENETEIQPHLAKPFLLQLCCATGLNTLVMKMILVECVCVVANRLTDGS